MYTPARFTRSALAAALITAAGFSSAAFAAYENFNQYPAGTALAGLNGGVGWNGGWRAVAGSRVSDQSVTYELGGRTLGGGCSLRVEANSDLALGRSFSPTVDLSGRDYFVSFLFRLEGKPEGTTFTTNVFAGWQAEDDSPSTSIDNIGYTGGAGRAGARVTNSSAVVSTPLVYGRTYRYVIKFTGWDGSRYNTTQVWLDPSESDEMSSDPAVTRTQTVAGGGANGLKGLRVRTLGLAADAYYLIDDVHVTHTWDELLRFPEVPDSPDPTVPQTYVITEGPDWKPYAHPLEVAPGGVFDYSHLLDAPAGKYGALRVSGSGQFEFAQRPNIRMRFAGVNLNFTAQFLSQSGANLLAETLARSGYNAVRFHHFDNELRVPAGGSFELNPDKLDQLHYLFAAMKRRGIYITIDLYSIRGFSQAEIESFGLAGPSLSSNGFKALIPIEEKAFQSWRQYAEKLLTSVNPYTGMTWAADPALIGICPVNEDNLYQTYESNREVKDRYEQLFNQAYPPSGESDAERNAKRFRFLCEVHAASDAKLHAYLRSLGVKALLTGANYGAAQALTIQRSTYEYVDNHIYFNHPMYPAGTGTLPLNTHNDSLIKRRATLPRDVMTSRIYGKPYTITEWNASRPNQFRGEAAALMPAYASLQDWDGLWCFQYGDTPEMIRDGAATGSFAITSDPIGMLMSRTTALLFLRGDIHPGKRTVVWAVRPEEAYFSSERTTSSHFLLTGLISQVGSLPGQPIEFEKAFDGVVTGATPALLGELPPNGYLADNDSLISRMITGQVLPKDSLTGYGETAVCVSDTGEITLNAQAGTAKVVTSASELFALAPGAQLSGKRVAVTNGSTPSTVSVITLQASEGQELSLEHARRILITHLTDALPKGMEFSTPERKRLLSWGKLPHLVLRGEASLSLDLPAGNWSAWVVDATGARVRPLPLAVSSEGRLILHLETITSEGVQLAYELVKAADAPRILRAASRRVHGSRSFDIPVQVQAGVPAPATALPVECRSGSRLEIVAEFDKPVTGVQASLAQGAGSLAQTRVSGNEVILSLADVPNGQTLTLSLSDIASSDGGGPGSASLRLGVLRGDVTGDGAVTSEDVGQVLGQAAIGGVPTGGTFRRDLNASNTFSSADYAIARAALGTSLR